MGGAIAVHTAFNNLIPSLVGLCVIDVVEGTAMDALSHMQGVLRGRPKTFKSLEYAIEWWLVKLRLFKEDFNLNEYFSLVLELAK